MRYFLLFLVLLPFFAFGQLQSPQDFDFVFINQEPDKVSKNSRLELGLTLPDSVMIHIDRYMRGKPNHRQGLNPFVSWDIDVKAHFKHKKSQEKFTAIGFWFTSIERDVENNRWNQLETKLPFRIRYAPSKLGDYEVYLTVKIRNQTAYKTHLKSFTVVASDYKGFVSLNDSTQYFERDGQTIIPTGVNLPFPSNKNNLMYSTDKEEELDLVVWEDYQDLVKDYALSGGDYFRFLLHPSAADIEFEEVGYYQDRQNFAWEIDNMLAFCEENNVLIQFNLMYHSYFMKTGDYHQFRFDFADHWYDPDAWPYEDKNLPSGYSVMLESKTPSDMFLKEKGMRYLKERARYTMARWGYSTSISAVELLCEPWHVDENPYANDTPYDELTEAGDTARKAVYEYHKKMASYIKDSLQYNQHPLGAVGRFPVGKTAIYSHFTEKIPDFVDSTWYLEDLDFISISYYSRSPGKLIYSKSNNNNKFGEDENSMANTIHRLQKTYNKPVMFGESDHGGGAHLCSDFQTHKIDVMRYPYTGAIGHFVWAAFIIVDKENKPYRNETLSWPTIIAAKEYYESDWFIDLINNKTVLGRQKRRVKTIEKDVVETQYIIGEEKAAGYVYNRTFNMFTAEAKSEEELEGTDCALIDSAYKTPIEIAWRPKRMKVEGLRAFTKYRVFYYDYQDHSFLLQTELRSNLFGKLKLTHPVLLPEKKKTPLLWYRIEKVK